MEIIVSKAARQDLVQIRQYIAVELCNPTTAARIIHLLKESILSLTTFPERGRPLDALLSIHTEYRYSLCEHYCIFYLCSDGKMTVVRILHQRQNDLQILFKET